MPRPRFKIERLSHFNRHDADRLIREKEKLLDERKTRAKNLKNILNMKNILGSNREKYKELVESHLRLVTDINKLIRSNESKLKRLGL